MPTNLTNSTNPIPHLGWNPNETITSTCGKHDAECDDDEEDDEDWENEDYDDCKQPGCTGCHLPWFADTGVRVYQATVQY